MVAAPTVGNASDADAVARDSGRGDGGRGAGVAAPAPPAVTATTVEERHGAHRLCVHYDAAGSPQPKGALCAQASGA